MTESRVLVFGDSGFGDTDTFVVDKRPWKDATPKNSLSPPKKIYIYKNPDIRLPTLNHPNSQYQNMVLQNNSKYYFINT